MQGKRNKLKYVRTIGTILKLLFCFKPKIVLIGEPKHPNLGDLAQRLCVELTLAELYPKYSIIPFGFLWQPFDLSIRLDRRIAEIFKLLVLKLTFRSKRDIIVNHSDFMFSDHHRGWLTLARILRSLPKAKVVVLPNTFHFFSPRPKEIARQYFSNNANILFLCRDTVSLQLAQELIKEPTKVLLFPDPVTAWVGTKLIPSTIRDGVLFCFRNDLEKHLPDETISTLKQAFTNYRNQSTDTVYPHRIHDPATTIDELLQQMATFKVIVTDRFHGMVFAVITGTPVVVFSAMDHKLPTGVEWFQKAGLGDKVKLANTTEEAKALIQHFLDNNETYTPSTDYFQTNYWQQLPELLLSHTNSPQNK